MNGWLLDTNVVSELRKRTCDVQVEIWVEAQPQNSLYLSVVSIAEIRFGIERATNDAKRHEIVHWLDSTLRPWFAGRMIGLDEETLFEWRRMVEACRIAGHPVGEPDMLIAATASRNGFCVATRNTVEFARAGVPVFDPWRNIIELPGRKAAKVNGVVTLDRLR